MNRATFNKAVVPGLLDFAVAGYQLKNKEQEWRKMVSVRSSKRAYEEIAYFAALGLIPKKPEGTAITYDDFVQGPTKRWTHVTYGLGCTITEEMIEDALYPDIPTRMESITRELGSSARETLNIIVFNMYNNLTSTTYHTGADALALASGSHTQLRGGTWSNLLSPAADLSASSLQTAIDNFETQKDDTGKRQILKAAKILVHPNNAWKAKELLNSGYDPESANNAVNTLKERNLQLMVTPYYTDTDGFTLIADPPNNSVGPIAFLRRNVNFAKDGDFETGDAKFKTTFRFSIETGSARNLYHSAGA